MSKPANVEVERDRAHEGLCNCKGCEEPAEVRLGFNSHNLRVSHWLCEQHASQVMTDLSLALEETP